MISPRSAYPIRFLVSSPCLGSLPEINGRVADKYVVESLIGRGGMGAVYRARHLLTGRRVALKWITSTNLGAQLEERILREAQAMGRIEHPNVCAVLDVGEDDGSMFLVMEYLEGMSLGEWAEGRALTPAEIIRALFGAMAGVAAAHREGVLHRDLKLDNIFVCLDKSGAFVTTKVLDFGISKLTNPQSHEVGLVTRTGQVMGTPHAMAPEQMLDEPNVDARVDVYALGVILYELLSGRLPYEAENYNRLVVQIAAGPGTPLSTYCPHHDPGLIAIVEKAVAHNRDDRFESVDAFAAALEPYADGARFSSPSGQFMVSARESHVPTLTPSELHTARTKNTPANEPPAAALAEPAPTPAREPSAPFSTSQPSLPPERPLPWGAFAAILFLVLAGLAFTWWWSSEPQSDATEVAPNLALPQASPDAWIAPDAGHDAWEVDAPLRAVTLDDDVAARVPTHPSVETPRPAVVSPADRPISGRSGVLNPDDF